MVPNPGIAGPPPGTSSSCRRFSTAAGSDQSQRRGTRKPRAASTWLVEHGLFDRRHALTEPDRRRVLEVREGLREMLFVNNGAVEDPDVVARLNGALRAPRIYVQLAVADAPEFKPQPRDLDGALALIATIVALSQLDGSWSRMKACRGRDCGWAFYDHSRNQASSWCAMSVCGADAPKCARIASDDAARGPEPAWRNSDERTPCARDPTRVAQQANHVAPRGPCDRVAADRPGPRWLWRVLALVGDVHQGRGAAKAAARVRAGRRRGDRSRGRRRCRRAHGPSEDGEQRGAGVPFSWSAGDRGWSTSIPRRSRISAWERTMR